GHGQTAGKCDPVPLVQTMDFKRIAGLFKCFTRELIRSALNLLHAQHIDIVSYEPIHHPSNTSPNRVHIPGGNTHSSIVAKYPRARPVWVSYCYRWSSDFSSWLLKLYRDHSFALLGSRYI